MLTGTYSDRYVAESTTLKLLMYWYLSNVHWQRVVLIGKVLSYRVNVLL